MAIISLKNCNFAPMQCAHDEQSTLHSSAKDPNSQLANKYTELPRSVA